MARKIRNDLIESTFDLFVNISEGNIDVIELVCAKLNSSEKSALLIMIAEKRLKDFNLLSDKSKNRPIVGGAIDDTVDIMTDIAKAIMIRDKGYFSKMAGKSIDEVSKVPEFVKFEAQAVATSLLSLMSKVTSTYDDKLTKSKIN